MNDRSRVRNHETTTNPWPWLTFLSCKRPSSQVYGRLGNKQIVNLNWQQTIAGQFKGLRWLIIADGGSIRVSGFFRLATYAE
jgi:hypothetical protein